MGPLAVLSESGNGDAAVVVGAYGTHESVANLSTFALEATRSTSIDNQVGLSLVNGVECRQGGYNI